MAKHLKVPRRILVVMAVAAVAACSAQEPRPERPEELTAYAAFPDFGHMISVATYDSLGDDAPPVFDLKHDYPASLPPESQLPAALGIDFRTDWMAYIMSVRDYCFEGNLPEWNPHANQIRAWYHIPWLHATPPQSFPPHGGTEGFHGLVKEAEVAPFQLAATQRGAYQVYAITLVNGFAGYTLGRMWRDPENPDPRVTDRRWGGGFPAGAVFCKLLFTDAPMGDDVVPFLENALEWQAYISESWNSPNRVVRAVRLLQMDIMVRDPRADDLTGWVFGTFVYNGELDNQDRFQNLVPLGLQWGNDPADTLNRINPLPPVETLTNPGLRETVINTSTDVPPQHLGWGYRLNGPADLNTSSCMSCHAAAEYPQTTSLLAPGPFPPLNPPDSLPPALGGKPEWMEWFQDAPAATPRDPRTYATDFSLQVGLSLSNFWYAKGVSDRGSWVDEYTLRGRPVARSGVRR